MQCTGPRGKKRLKGIKVQKEINVAAESSSGSCVWKNICTRLDAARLLFGFDFRTIILNYLRGICRRAASRAREGTSASFASAGVRSCCFLRLVMSHFCHFAKPAEAREAAPNIYQFEVWQIILTLSDPLIVKRGFLLLWLGQIESVTSAAGTFPGFLGASKQI